MAIIGEMHYLTIGENTYSIPISGGSTVTVTRSLTSGTKSATISVDGTNYDLYAPTPNAGTVTSVRIQATSPVQSSVSTAQSSTLNTTISLADGYGDTKNPYASKTKNYVLAAPSNAAGTPSFRALVAADIPDLSSTYLTSHQSIKTLHSKTLTGTGDVTLSYSDVGAAASSHAHGNITSGGDITATAPTIANGDQIIINDNSASKITNGPTFDGSTTTTALTPKGTWESFSKFSGSYNDLTNKPTIPTVPTNVSAFTNDAGYITSADVPEGASAYTGTISAVGTSASTGSNNGFARGDHVHNITKTTIDTQLGTGSGTTKFYREDGTWATPAYTTNTDTKLQIAAVTSGTTYYPIVAANSTTAATRQYDSTGIAYTGTNGTANGTNGNALLTLGNSTASTTANWKKGTVRLYGTTAYYTDLVSGGPTGNRTITFPDQTGTVALTSDIPDVSSFVTSSGVTSIATTSPISGGTITSTGTISHATSGVGNAVTTAGFYKFKYDTYGHVTGVTAVAASDITNLVTIPTNTDEKVSVAALTSGTTYYPILATGNGTATRQIDSSLLGLQYVSTAGTSSTIGTARLRIGNGTASGNSNNERGVIRIYGKSSVYTDIQADSSMTNKTITFPDKDGTVALTSDIPTVPTITLNGSATTSPSFYAPTGAGTSGQYLKSNGSGAPNWTNFPTIPSITLNGSATTSPSFYAPTSAGTSGYVLKSNGSGAPTWTSATLTDANVTQAASTSNTPQPILFRNNVNTDAAGSTEGVRYVSTVTVTPGTGNLQATTFNGYTLGAASAKAVVTSIDTSASLPTSNAVKTFVEGKGYITSYTDTNTTYSLSNALSSHKFTSTLTAGGSGSGTSTATMEFVAGTGITLTDDTTNKKITIASSVTVPTITLNGSSTTSPSFYAPTSAGTNGYYLKSNGSGAPTWASVPAGVTVTLNGSTTTTPSFYAPTSAGTNGYVLKSNGSGAPTWTSATLTDTKVTQNAAITTAGAYPIIIGSSTSTDGLTNSVNKTSTLTYNPSTQALVVGKSVQVDSWTWDSNTANHFSLKYSS